MQINKKMFFYGIFLFYLVWLGFGFYAFLVTSGSNLRYIAVAILSFWGSFNDFLKIFITLGAAITAYVIAVLLHSDTRNYLSSILFLLAGLLFPVGLYATIFTLKLASLSNNPALHTGIACLSWLALIISYYYFPYKTLAFLAVAASSWFFYSASAMLFTNTSLDFIQNYFLIGLGFVYIVLGRYLALKKPSLLTAPLYFIGALLFFFGLEMSNFHLTDSADNLIATPFRLMTIIKLLFGIAAFILALPFKSKSLLYVGAADLIFNLPSLVDFGLLFWLLLIIVIYLILQRQQQIQIK